MKCFLSFLFLGLASSVASVSFYSLVVDEWEVFKLQHAKAYKSGIEENFRRKIFAENKHKIAIHNKGYLQGKHTYELKMNQFGDMLHHEFRSMMNGFNGNLTEVRNFRDENAATFIEPSDEIVIPSQVDWRTKGAVTPVKNQGQCGSCWAFSSTGSLEGQHYRKTGKLVSLSEQNLVDCSTKVGNNGCNGGLMDYAFTYVKQNGGIDTEKSYPYEGQDDKCQFDPSTVGADDKGYVDVRAGSEKALKKAIATVGPISVAIDASHSSFQFYHQGVYYQEDCSSDELDHGVLAVGYGSEDGQDYWLVKNSWGEQWGEEGYIKMARNRDNNCGVASCASYPLV